MRDDCGSSLISALGAQIAEIGRKVIMVGFMAIIMPGTTEQLVIGFSFSLIFMLFTALMDPYRHNGI